MVNSEENMMNLKDAETRVIVGHSRTLTEKKCGGWPGYHISDRKLHHVTLSIRAVIPGLHTNIFSVKGVLQKNIPGVVRR